MKFIYAETNYEFETRTTVTAIDGLLLVSHVDSESGRLIGARNYCPSAEREVVAYAKKLCAGEVCKGDFVTF